MAKGQYPIICVKSLESGYLSVSEYDYIFSVDEVINEEHLNDVPEAFMPRSRPCPSTTDLPSPTSSPTISSPPVQMQVLRRTIRNAKNSYWNFLLARNSKNIGKIYYGNFFIFSFSSTIWSILELIQLLET